MSDRSEVLTDHRRRAMDGDRLQALLAANLDEVRRVGRRAGVATNMDTLQHKRIATASAAVSFFWNYNTVESVLLFSAVLVNLAGVMFESAQVRVRSRSVRQLLLELPCPQLGFAPADGVIVLPVLCAWFLRSW